MPILAGKILHKNASLQPTPGDATFVMPEKTSHKKNNDIFASVCCNPRPANVNTGKKTMKIVETIYSRHKNAQPHNQSAECP